MRYFIYCDESGEASFSEKTSFEYFSICALTIDESKRNKIKNTMRRKRAKLYNLGWPKEIEIKASILHRLKKIPEIPQEIRDTINGDDFIEEVLTSLKYSCSPRIDYIIVRKDGFTQTSFKNAPYGIVYNFLCSKILIPIILDYKDCFLCVHVRNKESRPKKDFNTYIRTEAFSKSFEKGVEISLEISHEGSEINYGLQAVDFFSWSVYKKKASKDSRFFKIFEDLVQIKEEWFC